MTCNLARTTTVHALCGVVFACLSFGVAADPTIDGYTPRDATGNSTEYGNFISLLWHSEDPYDKGSDTYKDGEQRTALYWDYYSTTTINGQVFEDVTAIYLEAPLLAKDMTWLEDENLDPVLADHLRDMYNNKVLDYKAAVQSEDLKVDSSSKSDILTANLAKGFDPDNPTLAHDGDTDFDLAVSGGTYQPGNTKDTTVLLADYPNIPAWAYDDKKVDGSGMIKLEHIDEAWRPFFDPTPGPRLIMYADSVSYVFNNRGCTEERCDAKDVPMAWEFLFSGSIDVSSFVEVEYHLSPAGTGTGSICNVPNDPTCNPGTPPNGVPSPPVLALLGIGLLAGGWRQRRQRAG